MSWREDMCFWRPDHDPRLVQDLTLQEVHAAVEVALKGPVPRRGRALSPCG